MYVILVDEGRRLITSDARALRLYDPSGETELVTEVEAPGELPFFEKSPSGERMTHAGGVVARSFTPLGLDVHWVSAPSSVALYSATDLRRLALLELGQRLDHESLSLSPDGRLLASVARGGGAVVFDADTGAKRWQLDGEIASGICWSPDGRHLALGETGQGGGELTLIDTTPASGGAPEKLSLPPPTSKCGLFDSPYRTAFSGDGRLVVFTSASWGSAGVSLYDVATRAEAWSVSMPTTDGEDVEHWLAPEVTFALDDRLILAGQDGLVQAFRTADGHELSRLEYERADARYFAADTGRRRIWLTRGGQPASVAFPDDWR